MSDEPFGRQPKPVVVSFSGEQVDIDYWLPHLKRRAEFKGDMTQQNGPLSFTIYPRAVND